MSAFDPRSYAVVVFTDLVLENNVVNGVTSLVSWTGFSHVDLIGKAGTTHGCL